MTEKSLNLNRKGYSDSEAAKQLFPKAWSNRFWSGVGAGILIMCFFDLTDLHICIGECNAAGYDLWSSAQRK